MQRELAATSTAFVVYTGDVGTHDGAVTKADILAKVEVRPLLVAPVLLPLS